MYISLDELIRHFNEADTIIVNKLDFSGEIVYKVLSEVVNDKKILPFYGGSLVGESSRYYINFIRKKSKKAVLLGIYNIHPGLLRKEIINERVILASDSLNISNLQDKFKGQISYLTNKRVLPMNSNSSTFSLAETVYKILNELDYKIESLKEIHINDQKIPLELALILAHFDDNPDSANPLYDYNSFLLENSEKLGIKDVVLNLDHRIPQEHIRLMANLGFVLNTNPDSILSPKKIVQDFKIKNLDDLLSEPEILYSPEYKGKSVYEWLVDIKNGYPYPIETSIRKTIKIIGKAYKVLRYSLENSSKTYISSVIEKKHDLSIGKYKTGDVYIYSIKVDINPGKYYTILAALPKNSILISFSSREKYKGSRGYSFFIWSKPYDPLEILSSKKLIFPPAYITTFGLIRTIEYIQKFKYHNKRRFSKIRAAGGGDVTKGYAWISESIDITPYGFILAINSIFEPRSSQDLRDYIGYYTLYNGEYNIGILSKSKTNKPYILVSAPPWEQEKTFYGPKDLEKIISENIKDVNEGLLIRSLEEYFNRKINLIKIVLN